MITRIGQIWKRATPQVRRPVYVGLAVGFVLAGFMTHMCINSTARGAFNLGYSPTVIASATATRDLPLAGGGEVSAAALQAASLAALGDLFAVVVRRADDLAH